jgi:hypothetical protein
MAFRRPVVIDGTNLREMTDAEIGNVRLRAKWKYIANPSVRLSVVGSGGSLGNLTDTRLTAGNWGQRSDRYPNEGETQEPQVVTVNYARVTQTVDTVNVPNFVNPLYYDGGNLREMTNEDVYDTITKTAMQDVYDEIYYVSNNYTQSGYTRVSDTVIMQDTGANTGAYTADSIPETNDQSYVRQNFYLHKVNNSSASSLVPVRLGTNNNPQQIDSGAFDLMLDSYMRYTASHVSGYRNRYSWNGTGVGRGSVWDDRLNGSGNYQVRFVHGDDYRAQEFPNGSFYRVSTWELKSRLE